MSYSCTLTWSEVCCTLTLMIKNSNFEANSFKNMRTGSNNRKPANWTLIFTNLKQTIKYSGPPFINHTTSAEQNHPFGKPSSYKEEINPDLTSQYSMVYVLQVNYCVLPWKVLHITKYPKHFVTLQNYLPPPSHIWYIFVQLVFGLVSHAEDPRSCNQQDTHDVPHLSAVWFSWYCSSVL